MALCAWCGKFNDQADWPVEYQVLYRPDLCFSCYSADPDRLDQPAPKRQQEETTEEPAESIEDAIDIFMQDIFDDDDEVEPEISEEDQEDD